MKLVETESNIDFRDWIQLNISSITWEGRYIREFNDFWHSIFGQDRSNQDQILSLNSLIAHSQDGPLIAWFKWIKFKFLAYLFIFQNYTLEELADLGGYEISELATELRVFFVDRYPEYEETINEKFQISNALSEYNQLKFEELSELTGENEQVMGSLPGEVLSSLEVTLYPDWGKLLQLVQAKNEVQGPKKSPVNSQKFFSSKLQFFSEILLLFFLGALLIFGIKFGNTLYEEYLVKSISLFEPNFLKLDTSLAFKVDNKPTREIAIKLDELENLEKLENKKVFEDNIESQRFEVESDVVLTSVDSLPKDFDIANMEQSDYEELKKGGYRNSRYGRKKAYRVMMTSVDPKLSKKQLLPLLDKYKIEQVDNVKPGTAIPGGIYFNLYVLRASLKDFLEDVSEISEATILESRTSRAGGPPGSDKVFIWIKSI